MEPTLVLAALAGLVSFLSLLTLPGISSFFAQLAGTSLGTSGLRRQGSLFLAGFCAIFKDHW